MVTSTPKRRRTSHEAVSNLTHYIVENKTELQSATMRQIEILIKKKWPDMFFHRQTLEKLLNQHGVEFKKRAYRKRKPFRTLHRLSSRS